jgi:hypothetical protein
LFVQWVFFHWTWLTFGSITGWAAPMAVDWHALNHVALKLHLGESIPYSWKCDLSQSDATVGPLRLHCNLVDVSRDHSINIQNQYQTWHRCWNNPEQPLASNLKSITSTTGLQLQVWDGIRDRCREVLIVWKVRWAHSVFKCVRVTFFWFPKIGLRAGNPNVCYEHPSWFSDENALNQWIG